MSENTSSPVTRRLAAIVIADVVGYTRLMERDDTGTYARVRLIRDEVVDPAIVSHGGRVVKSAGDGLLAEFSERLGGASRVVARMTACSTRLRNSRTLPGHPCRSIACSAERVKARCGLRYRRR
jgi:class 3 adenylate cyclase